MANPYTPMFQQYGQAFGVNPNVLSNIARLESNYNPGAVNNWDSNAIAGTPSKGMMQFIQPTFNSFYDKAASTKPQMFAALGPKNWMNPEQQIATTAWALANGLGSHWATYDRAKNSISPTPNQAAGFIPNQAAGLGGASPNLAAQINAKYDMIRAGGVPAPIEHAVNRLPQLRTSPGMVSGLGGQYTGPALSGWKALQDLGRTMFGLRNDPGTSQTTGGGHVANSQHYSGHAIDFGTALNTQQQLNDWYNYLDQNRQQLGITELINEGSHIHAGVR